MTSNPDNVGRGEAQDALESVEKMQRAAWRRAVPDRWFGAGVAALIASLYSLYALDDPYPYIIFPIIGLAVFITSARDKSGAYGQEFPSGRVNVWATVLVAVVMLIIFFGSIIVRRTYDLAWVPVVAGLLVGLMVFLGSENERRAYLTKSDQR